MPMVFKIVSTIMRVISLPKPRPLIPAGQKCGRASMVMMMMDELKPSPVTAREAHRQTTFPYDTEKESPHEGQSANP